MVFRAKDRDEVPPGLEELKIIGFGKEGGRDKVPVLRSHRNKGPDEWANLTLL